MKNENILFLEHLPIVDEQFTAHGFLSSEVLRDPLSSIYQDVIVKKEEEGKDKDAL